MSGDVTPESLRALADKALRRGYEFDADRRAEFAHGLRAAADALEVAEAKLARVREWFVDPMEDEALTWSRLEAILDDTEGGKR